MAKFRIQKSFGIDKGELEGLSPQQVFCLGYELADIDAWLRYDPRPLENKPVHSDNVERIKSALQNSGRKWKLTWLNDDWLRLDVEGERWHTPRMQDDDDGDANHQLNAGNGLALLAVLCFGIALVVTMVVLYSFITPITTPMP